MREKIHVHEWNHSEAAGERANACASVVLTGRYEHRWAELNGHSELGAIILK